jgi:hypothetical protein
MNVRELAAVAAGFSAVTLAFTMPLATRIATDLAGPGDDARLNAWILAWGADRMLHGLRGFWSPPVFYPYENTLAYSENLLGISVFVAPAYWLSQSPILVYNAAFLLAYVLSAVGAYVLARELTGRRDAALVAAAAFAFAPYRWAQLAHLQVLSAGWLPLSLWAVHRAFRAPSWPVVAVFVASFVIMAFSNGYAAYQTAFAVGLVACWSAVKLGVTRRQLVRLGLAAAVIGLLLAPAIVTHMHVWADRSPSRGDFIRYSIDLSSYLSVADELPQASWLPGMPQGEGRYFPGVLVVLLATVALLPSRPLARLAPVSEWRWLYLGLAAIGALLSLGPRPRAWGQDLPFLPVYGWLLDVMPLFHALRVPARFGMLVVVAFSVLAAMGAGRLFALVGHRTAVAGLALLLPVIVWEGRGGSMPTSPVEFRTARGDQAAYAWLARQPPGPVLDLPLSGMGGGGFSMKMQYATLRHRHWMIGGVSRVHPPLDDLLAGPASPITDRALHSQVPGFLQALGVRHVLVRPEFFSDAAVAAGFMRALESHGASRLVEVFDDVFAFEIAPGIEREEPPAGLAPIAASSLVLNASRNADRVALAIDGDPATRWLSGAPQAGREWIEIAFDRPRDVGRIEFVTSRRSLHDFPRGIEVVATGFSAGAEQQVLYRGPVLEQYARAFLRSPELPAIAIDLPSHLSLRLLIRQTGRAAPWYWSIDELTIWERPAR